MNWDIKKNELVLNVTWLNRVSEVKSLEFTPHMPQTITLSSVLPAAAVWEKMNGNTYTLSQLSHDKMCGWRDCVRSDLHKERNKLLSEARPAVMGSARSSFQNLPLTLKKLTTMRRNAEATAIAAAAAFGAHSAWRRSNIAMLHAGTIDEDDLPLCMMNELEAKKKRNLELATKPD